MRLLKIKLAVLCFSSVFLQVSLAKTLAQPYLSGAEMSPADQIESLERQLQQLEYDNGGTDGPVLKILNYVVGLVGAGNGEHSLFVAGDDGHIHHAGVIGDLIGAVLGIAGLVLGGNLGMCGNGNGLFMKDNEGLVGKTLNLLTPVLGPLASDTGDDVQDAALDDQAIPVTGSDPFEMEGDQMTELVANMQEIQKASGGLAAPVPKILNYLTGALLQAHADHSIFVPSPDGKIHHGGLLGDLVGALLGTVGYLLGGEHGMCGGPYGAYLHQHEGLLGSLLDVLGLVE